MIGKQAKTIGSAIQRAFSKRGFGKLAQHIQHIGKEKVQTIRNAFSRNVPTKIKEYAHVVGENISNIRPNQQTRINSIVDTAKRASRNKKVATSIPRKLGTGLLYGGFVLGAVSMVGLNVMKGGMSQARDIVHERYMQDYTYSRNMLHNSRVGLASGTNTMLNRGGTQGLSLSLSKTRHGRY